MWALKCFGIFGAGTAVIGILVAVFFRLEPANVKADEMILVGVGTVVVVRYLEDLLKKK